MVRVRIPAPSHIPLGGSQVASWNWQRPGDDSTRVRSRGESIQIVGLEREGPMLKEAMQKRAGLDEDVRRCLAFVTGDMRAWRAEQVFDLVIAPCSSLSHLLTLDDQIAAWRCAWDSLVTADASSSI